MPAAGAINAPLPRPASSGALPRLGVQAGLFSCLLPGIGKRPPRRLPEIYSAASLFFRFIGALATGRTSEARASAEAIRTDNAPKRKRPQAGPVGESS